MELVTLLTASNRTHSQLQDLLPEKSSIVGLSKEFEDILGEVAVFQPPKYDPSGAMQQGVYVPKGTFLDFFFKFNKKII